MSKRTCGKVLLLQSHRLVRPVVDDNFVKLLYSLQNCVISCHRSFMKKSHPKFSKNEPENIP